MPGRSIRRAMALGATLLCAACTLSEAPVVNPKGPIALAERDLLFTAVGLMLIVVVPVLVAAPLFARLFRSSNRKEPYAPEWSSSGRIEAVLWLVPAVIVAALGVIAWQATHRLDPYRPLAASAPPLEVDVVALDWKWLFIYPEQGIAAVNELVFPSGRPLSLKITSDTVMNSFSLPALGGQIYAMAGMQTQLHLLADAPGRFVGRNMQYSGSGFSDQQFDAIATSQVDFDAWVTKVRHSSNTLDADAYRMLAARSVLSGAILYSAVEPELFDTIVGKYGGHHAFGGEVSTADSGTPPASAAPRIAPPAQVQHAR